MSLTSGNGSTAEEREIIRLRAALDEANTSVEQAVAMANDNAAEIVQLVAERDQAVATAVRWEDRASFLERSHDHAVAQVQDLTVALRRIRSIGARSGTELDAMNKVFDVIDAALAGQDNGDPETALKLSDLTRGFYPDMTGGLSASDYLDHCRGECNESSPCEAARGPQGGATP